MSKILINWYYERPDLTEYLLGFTETIEFVFLYKQFSEPAPDYLTKYKNISIVYWADYNTPGKLLCQINPDCVVFCDLEAFNQIALNIAARNRGITTYVLQHGQRGSFEVEEALTIAAGTKSALQISPTTWWSIRFLLTSLRFKNRKQLPALLKFIYARKTKELTVALQQNQFELRRADYYIEFSEENAGYHKLRDGIENNRFIITGNPFFDQYIDYFKNQSKSPDEKYYLLIDCPFVEGNFLRKNKMTGQEKNSYLVSMNKLTRSMQAKLYVKLHPLSYKTNNLPADENIIYFRDADIKKLAAEASLIFFVHFSTLSPVLLSFKPCVYFNSGFINHAGIFKRLNVTAFNLIPFTCQSDDLLKDNLSVDNNELIKFIYKPDGKAGERIKSILVNK